MFPFSNNYLSKHKIFFLVLFYITGNYLLSQNINYSAGKISSDANKRLILEQSVKLNIDNIAISTEKLIIDQEKEIGFDFGNFARWAIRKKHVMSWLLVAFKLCFFF